MHVDVIKTVGFGLTMSRPRPVLSLDSRRTSPVGVNPDLNVPGTSTTEVLASSS